MVANQLFLLDKTSDFPQEKLKKKKNKNKNKEKLIGRCVMTFRDMITAFWRLSWARIFKRAFHTYFIRSFFFLFQTSGRKQILIQKLLIHCPWAVLSETSWIFTSLLPPSLPSFLPSLFPSFLPSFFPSFLPSFLLFFLPFFFLPSFLRASIVPAFFCLFIHFFIIIYLQLPSKAVV